MSPRDSLVSVIIPCHNAEQWIGETLESVAMQRDVTCEVIVVDDGSTDASVRVAESIGGRGVRIVRQEQQGVGAARNAGTAIARGAFLQYLDADDVLSPGAVRQTDSRPGLFDSATPITAILVSKSGLV